MSKRRDNAHGLAGADFPLARSVLAVAVSGVLAAPAGANPTGAQVTHGQATFANPRPGELSITNSPGAIIHWQDFSISRGELTRFVQQHGASAVLNRVTGNMPSDIRGSLLSNGRVFLINRNGIVFGKHALIDTAGMVASSLDIADADFLAGRLAFSGDGGSVTNQGFIRVRPGGEIVLVAPDVTNTGILQAEDGSVVLAAGRDMVIESMDFEHVRFRVQAPDDQVLNLGRIITSGGVTALFAGTLRHDGVIEANRVRRGDDGRIRLEASHEVRVGGRIAATGEGTRGGQVDITGNTVTLSGAEIDVSGDSGGGRARIGGGYQGGGDLRGSRQTRLDVDTSVRADARQRGDGGEVIVWSDGDTDTRAALSARGGPAGGDGGLVETSGRRTLAFGQPADVSAPAGRGGTWLLDPEDIHIGDDEAASISAALDTGSNVSVKTSDTGDGEGNITVASAISKTAGDDAALSMDAHNRIDVNAPITSTSGKLDVSLAAGSAVHVNAEVRTNGGNFAQVVTGLASGPGELPADEPLEAPADDGEAVADAGDENVNNPVDGDPAGQPAEGASSSTPPPEPDLEMAAIEPPLSDAIDSDPAFAEVDEPPAPSLPDGFGDDFQAVIRATVDTDGGDILVDAGRAGTTGVFADVDASSEDGQGGNIRILGQRIGIYGDSTVDASGETGGGTVLVGGDQQGRNPEVPNARAVTVGPEASIRADATGQGDGGRVIVYADHTANVLGHLSARGGATGGNGGFVETSGKTNLRVARAPDTRAPAGQGGTWLIDPTNITVVSGAADDNVQHPGDYSAFYANGSGAEISVGTIYDGLYYGGTVAIHADSSVYDAGEDGNITWLGDADLDGYGMSYGASNYGNLYLYADGDINFYGRIFNSSLYYGGIGSVHFIADNDSSGAGSVNILGGGSGTGAQIDIAGDFVARGAAFTASGGGFPGEPVTVRAAGMVDIDVAGDVSLTAGASDSGVLVEAGTGMRVIGNNVSVLASGNADAELLLSAYAMDPDAGAPPVFTQYVHARNGNVTVRGGGTNDQAGITAQLDVYTTQDSDSASHARADLVQRVKASGDIVVEAGFGANSDAYIGFHQDFETYSADDEGALDFTITLHGQQFVEAGGDIHILGGNAATAEGKVTFVQVHDLEIDNGHEDSSWVTNFSGGQYVDAAGDINLASGAGSGSEAFIDPEIRHFSKYNIGTVDQQVNVTTRQQVRAGHNGDGALNITAIGADAWIGTGGYSHANQDALFGTFNDTYFGTDQFVSADRLNIISETTDGAVAQIELVDGANLDGTGNPGYTQTIEIGGDALLRSAGGGIARIVNQGLNGSVTINGDLDFHGDDSLVQLSSTVAGPPAPSGTLNVLGDTNLSGAPSVTGNGNVVLEDASGVGTLNAANVFVNGTLAPGNSPGVLVFPGNLTLAGTTNTLMEIGGTPASGLYDRINVGGTVTLAGTMTVVLINGFSPNGALVYDLISAGTVNGAFAAFSGPGFNDGQNTTTYFVSSGPLGPAGPPPGPGGPSLPTPTPPGGPPGPPFEGLPPDPFGPVVSLLDTGPLPEEEIEVPGSIGLCTASTTT